MKIKECGFKIDICNLDGTIKNGNYIYTTKEEAIEAGNKMNKSFVVVNLLCPDYIIK